MLPVVKCVNLWQKRGEMSIDNQLLEDTKLAMKAGEKQKVETLRTLRAQIKDARIAKREDLNDDEIIKVLSNAAKKRKEAIEMYASANRNDLVDKETFQLKIIQYYLPEQLSESEIEKIVTDTKSDLNISSDKEFGRLMGAVMQKVKGKADGKLVQQLVKKVLSELN